MHQKDDVWNAPAGAPHHAADEPHIGNNDPLEFVLIRRIELLGRMHHRCFSNILQKDGLPPAQMGALKQIISQPGMSQQELADRLHVKRATTSVMLQKMERNGYISRTPDPADQRVSRIYPTDLSVQMDADNRRMVDTYFESCFNGFSEEEKNKLNRFLERLKDNLSQISLEDTVPGKE